MHNTRLDGLAHASQRSRCQNVLLIRCGVKFDPPILIHVIFLFLFIVALPDDESPKRIRVY